MMARPWQRLITQGASRFPSVARWLTHQRLAANTEPIPWAPLGRKLSESTVALVTTAGLHHLDQRPFDLMDPHGDPTFREIDADRITGDYRIAHDHYDHQDADLDINVVFPIDRLLELAVAGCINRVADRHYSFMGHIEGPHVATLVEKTAAEVAKRLVIDQVDAVVLTPG